MMNYRSTLLAAAILAMPISILAGSFDAEAKPVYVGVEGENIAVGGYDTVSYFRGTGEPVKGSEDFSMEYDGAVYYFSSAENRAAFAENPDAYVPQYGGHCAWAMSRGSLAPGDPTLYKIVDGRLHLNFNEQVQQTWLKDVPGFVMKADAEWQTIPDDAKFGG